MTDSTALREIIKSKGIKYVYIAQELGITPYCLQRKIDNDNDFKGKEIAAISQILALSNQQRDAIFFAQNVDFKSTKQN